VADQPTPISRLHI